MEFSACQQWKIAFIHAFASTFNPQQIVAPAFFRLPEFTPSQLELEIQKEESDLVHSIACSCLGNVFNRKNPIESFNKTLCDLVSEKMKTLDIDLEKNPLRNQKFYTLSADLKLQMLYCMIEWQLQDSQAVRSIIEHYKTKKVNPIKLSPVGTDKNKNAYWQFGESGYLWKESSNKKKWEIVCKDKSGLEEFAEGLNKKNRSEKALSNYIIDVICPIAVQEKKRLDKIAYDQWRKETAANIILEPVETRSQKRPRERVNYNYDDFLMDTSSSSSDSEDLPEQTPIPHPKRTRFSSRINNNIDQESEAAFVEENNEINEEANTSSEINQTGNKIDENLHFPNDNMVEEYNKEAIESSNEP